MKYPEIIKEMTLEEKAAMMSGRDTWTTVGYEKWDIPSIFLSDGPHGLRKQAGAADHLGLNASLPATCYPTAATMANSWDEELGEQLGRNLGEEAAVLGVNVVLGPGLNVKRNPLCGRNFEYFSEDPYLAGKMAAAYVRGIQSNGISACPKHFAANSQELRRMANDSVMDERTFRELYATGFEIAVKEGGAKSIMTAYNQVNGTYANENPHMIQDLLRDEWGFEGMVVSDWGGSNDHVEGVRVGSHLEMPSTGKMGTKQLVKAVEEGRLDESILDQRVDELLDFIFSVRKATEEAADDFDVEAHHAFARKAAAQSIVLLKNDNSLLPLGAGTKVAVLGDFAQTPRYQGAGSSLVNPTALETFLDEMEKTDISMTAYAQGYLRNQPTDQGLLENAVKVAKSADVVILMVGLDEISESEGLDRTHMRMPQAQLDLIDAVVQANEHVVVVMSAGSSVEMPWIDKVDAVLHGYLGGQAGAGAMLDVLTGKVCPSGKLNETYLLRYEDTPSAPYYPSRERSSEYREGLFVGYRYFDKAETPVLFPFGYGLSYTTFAYDHLVVGDKGVTLTVTNTGACDGAEIVQLYVGKKDSSLFGPKKELKGFKKVFLAKGESKEITIAFDDKTFRYFNVATDKWEVEGGAYELYIAANVCDVRLTGEITVAGTDAPNPYDAAKLPSYYSGRVADVSDEEFAELYGGEVPDGSWNTAGLLEANDALCQMYYAKSWLARLVYRVLTSMKESSEKKGKPNLNVLFIYNMPFRGLSKMTGGSLNEGMVDGILQIVNGHFFKGLGRLIASTIKG